MDKKHVAAEFVLKKDSIREEETDGGKFAFFEGYASTFGNIDRVDDVIMRGAFKRCLDKGKLIKMLWQHKFDTVIGQFPKLVEDESGLFVQGRINLGTEKGREGYALLKAGDINSMSIGYMIVDAEYNRDLDVRMLKELDLFEVSLVTEPANELALVTSVKGWITPDELPVLEDPEYKFIKSDVEGRIEECKKSAYLWHGDAGEHKFLWADMVDGKLTIIPAAVEQVVEDLKDYEEHGLTKSDVIAIREQLSKQYYKRINEIEPWRVKSIEEFESVGDAETWLRSVKEFSGKEAKKLISALKSMFSQECDAVEGKSTDQKECDAVDDLGNWKDVTEQLQSIKQLLLRGNSNDRGNESEAGHAGSERTPRSSGVEI